MARRAAEDAEELCRVRRSPRRVPPGPPANALAHETRGRYRSAAGTRVFKSAPSGTMAGSGATGATTTFVPHPLSRTRVRASRCHGPDGPRRARHSGHAARWPVSMPRGRALTRHRQLHPLPHPHGDHRRRAGGRAARPAPRAPRGRPRSPRPAAEGAALGHPREPRRWDERHARKQGRRQEGLRHRRRRRGSMISTVYDLRRRSEHRSRGLEPASTVPISGTRSPGFTPPSSYQRNQRTGRAAVLHGRCPRTRPRGIAASGTRPRWPDELRCAGQKPASDEWPDRNRLRPRVAGLPAAAPRSVLELRAPMRATARAAGFRAVRDAAHAEQAYGMVRKSSRVRPRRQRV